MAQLEGAAKQRYVAALFARIAGRYDLMNDLMTTGQHRRWKRRTARLTATGLQGKALDIAIGTGDLAMALARCPEIQHAVGVDLLPNMAALDRARTQARGLAGKTTLLIGDAMELPFPGGAFACAAADFSLRNMPDLRGALAKMVRVVRPGGPKARLFRWYFHHVVPLVGRVVAGDRSAYTYLPQSVDNFLEADRLAELFRELGLAETGYLQLGMGTVTLHWSNRPPA
jgi:demethylmenaquinone methyltransferase/2-methoxy-6-polyprenyl-1,4-benzoquinol methylase